jgi:hypothetical protein
VADGTGRRYLPDIVEISTAAKLIRANVFVDGQRIGSDPNGWPIYRAYASVRVDMRPGSRFK